MRKNIIVFIIIFLIVIFGIIFLGYLKNKTKEKKPAIVEVSEETKPAPFPIEEQKPISSPTEITTTTPTTTQPTKTFQLLFNQPFLYLDLDYPLLYVYDPQEGVIKYLDLENETYKEIYKIFDLKNAIFSEDKSKIVLQTETGMKLLDLKGDLLEDLPPLVQKFTFLGKDLILYLNDKKTVSYLAYWRNGKAIKIRNLGLLNPEILPFKDNILIYENQSPVFILNLKSPDSLKVFLEPKENYSLLPNKNQNLIFISFKKNGWQSSVIDANKKTKVSFSWGTIKEKCSFDDLLICAVPLNLENFDPEAWHILEPSYDEKIIIYRPEKNEFKEIPLEEKFDIVKPKLTPLGIVFWNRLDAKFYLIKSENLPF